MNVITSSYCYANVTHGTGSRFKAVCPTCGGRNLYVTVDNGRAYCFNCAVHYTIDGVSTVYKNTMKTLKHTEAQIRLVYQKVCELYQNALRPIHREYLLRRGLSNETIDIFKIGYGEELRIADAEYELYNDAGLLTNGKASLSRRIIIPYAAQHTITDLRGRTTENEDPKYKSLCNSAYLRGAIYPFNWDLALERVKDTKTLLITEGEFKAIAAHQAGHACVALPGILSWRQGLRVDKDWRIVIIFDRSAQASAMNDIDRAIRRVSSRLQTQEIYIGVLPLLGEPKMDIDSFLVHSAGGPQQFDTLVNNALPYDYYKQLRRF